MTLEQLKQLCIKNKIPIVRDKTLELIKEIIIKNNYSSILEIGSAYGYSALSLSQIKSISKIISVEKNRNNYLIAKQFSNTKLQFINVDAFEFECNDSFDLIFIDGPKSHQEILFNKYLNNLKDNGTIFIDNIFLKKFDHLDKLTKNQNNLVNKVKAFREWLLSNPNIKVEIIDIDDGIAIISKKNNK